MKLSQFLVILAALNGAQSTQAGLILGWHEFGIGTTANSNAPDYSSGAVSGVFSPVGATYLAGAGSSDGTYGNLPGFLPAPAINDGRINLNSSQAIDLFVTNPTLTPKILDALYFDWANGGTPGPRTVTTSFTDAFNVTTIIGSASESTTTFASIGQDLSALNFFVAPGATVKFTFTNTAGGNAGRLDNIALSAIPEATPAIALAGLIGSGLLIRRRPAKSAFTA